MQSQQPQDSGSFSVGALAARHHHQAAAAAAAPSSSSSINSGSNDLRRRCLISILRNDYTSSCQTESTIIAPPPRPAATPCCMTSTNKKRKRVPNSTTTTNGKRRVHFAGHASLMEFTNPPPLPSSENNTTLFYTRTDRKRFSKQVVLDALRVKQRLRDASLVLTKDSDERQDGMLQLLPLPEEIIGLEQFIFYNGCNASPPPTRSHRAAHVQSVLSVQRMCCALLPNDVDNVEMRAMKLSEFCVLNSSRNVEDGRKRGDMAAF